LNKRKIVNDPVYGFINIPNSIVYDLIEHPYFQRLRRIKQLGLTNLVYPGAFHTRFQHALGAMHLTTLAIEVLRQKGHVISDEEAEAALIAILLHDIGHGPYSHALEYCIIPGISHEELSLAIMNELNTVFNGRLSLAIDLFQGKYHKKFLHQLVSGQLDMDRLDYLRRDSFFTGVSEGVVSSDRIIKMLEVVDDELVVEAKGIYSIEKFIIARRLMYWQVYLHKTVLASELMLTKCIGRARQLVQSGIHADCSEPLSYFLILKHFEISPEMLAHFTKTDDYDVMYALKKWTDHDDFLLQYLSSGIIDRHLFKVKLEKEPFSSDYIEKLRKQAAKHFNIGINEASHLVFTDAVSNNAYSFADEKINILVQGRLVDVTEASDMLNHSVMSKTVRKHILCFPTEIQHVINQP